MKIRKNILAAFLASLVLLLSLAPLGVLAEGDIPDERQIDRVVDQAEVITVQEWEDLLARTDEIAEREDFDIGLITLESLDGDTATSWADDIYDYMGFGMGSDRDGILFLVGVEERQWAISTHGWGIEAFTDKGQEHLMESVLPYLKEDDYAGAFGAFLDQTEDFVAQAKTGEPYDVGNLPKNPLPWYYIPLSLVLGGLVGFVATRIMKNQLKTVRNRANAQDYVVDGSLALTLQNDRFLYKDVVATKKEKNDSGGSSTHTSSSGSTHGGSSGSY